MKNKQIIVDNINVSECENSIQGKHAILCASSYEDSSLCDVNKNCLYKKYKRKEQECEELKHQIEDADTLCSEKESLIDKYFQILIEIKEIAEGMHDLWINKTKYTDIDNLVKHLLECELSRIIYKLDEISECEVENNEKN